MATVDTFYSTYWSMKVYFSKNTYNLFIEGNLNALELPLAVPVLITVEYPGVVDGVEDDLFLKSKNKFIR